MGFEPVAVQKPTTLLTYHLDSAQNEVIGTNCSMGADAGTSWTTRVRQPAWHARLWASSHRSWPDYFRRPDRPNWWTGHITPTSLDAW